MKRVEYFNTKEELERYYENGVPSTVLAVVQADASEPAVLYASSNNSPVEGGSTEQQGGMIPPTGYILPEGTYDITTNGLADISTYAYVDVNVSGGGVTPSGYAYVTTNGDHNVAAYEMVNVDVPIPAGYIKPAGGITVTPTANGQSWDCTSYERVKVLTTDVPINWDIVAGYGYIVPSGTINFTENSNGLIWNIASYESATVNVSIPSGYIVPTGTYSVTTNGEYEISSYSYVTVNVAGGGSGPDPNLRNLTHVECDIHDDDTDADYVAYLPQSYSYFTISGSMRHYFESVTDPETEEEIGDWVDDNYFNVDVDDGEGSTTGMECYTGGFTPFGRIADEVEDDGNGGTEPRVRGIRIDMPEQYLGDMLNYMYWDDDNGGWGTIPASGTWTVHAEFDESNPGFYFANANMADFDQNDWSFDYTVKIPNNFYYYGNCDVYIDWTFTGQLNSNGEEEPEE